MFLKSIRVENVRAIAESELDFDDESGGTRKWTLLLGENGTGKSTLLRCIASLLCGRDALPELLGRDPSSWIRSGQSNACIDGIVKTVGGGEQPIRLELQRDDTISQTLDRIGQQLAPFEVPRAHGDRYFLAGYGASRRFGRLGIGRDRPPSGRAGMVRTLFDADATLWPLASWAMDLHLRQRRERLGPDSFDARRPSAGRRVSHHRQDRQDPDLRHGGRTRCAGGPERRLSERGGVGG